MMIAWLKRHHVLHTWGKWEAPVFKHYDIYLGEAKVSARTRHVQDRYCERCGARERRFLE